MKIEIALTTKQKEIVSKLDGNILVQAGPGSGKTRVLIERTKHLLQSDSNNTVLALTFSNLAADEMMERITEDTIIDRKRIKCSTIHSFSMELVQSYGHMIGLEDQMFIFDDNASRKDIILKIILDNLQLKNYYSSLDLKTQNQKLNNIIERISFEKRNLRQPIDEDCSSPDIFKRLYYEYNLSLKNQNAMDFDDILIYAYNILNAAPFIVQFYNSAYTHVMVDEAQDLNFAQYSVIKTLCGQNFNNLMFVGDPMQSIYGFNGSDSKYMTEAFVADFSPQPFQLLENFRSAQNIINFANEFAENKDNQTYPYKGVLCKIAYQNEEAEADGIVKKINYYIKYGHAEIENEVSCSDIAIIARNRYVFEYIQKALDKNDIPYYIKQSSRNVQFESTHVKILNLGIISLLNEQDITHKSQLLRTSKLSESLVKCSWGNIMLAMCKTEYRTIAEALMQINDSPDSLPDILNSLVAYYKNCDDCDENERYLIVNDLKTLLSAWDKFCATTERRNQGLIAFRQDLALGKLNEETRNDEGIALLTVHMSKGLQFEIVFLVGMTEGTFPDYRATSELELGQEKNNIFVAVSRAKRLCFLSWPRVKKMPWGDCRYQNESRFIRIAPICEQNIY